jgi:hypothetical protein
VWVCMYVTVIDPCFLWPFLVGNLKLILVVVVSGQNEYARVFAIVSGGKKSEVNRRQLLYWSDSQGRLVEAKVR